MNSWCNLFFYYLGVFAAANGLYAISFVPLSLHKRMPLLSLTRVLCIVRSFLFQPNDAVFIINNGTKSFFQRIKIRCYKMGRPYWTYLFQLLVCHCEKRSNHINCSLLLSFGIATKSGDFAEHPYLTNVLFFKRTL